MKGRSFGKNKQLIASLQETIEEKEKEINDLQIMYDNVVEHGTFIENDLEKANIEMKQLLNSMKKYLSSQLFNTIVQRSAEQFDLPYERKKLTVFFSDIVGFTQITDTLEPEALSTLLNDYLNEMSKIATKYGGTIDKFIGDSVMVFFGDSDDADDCEQAGQCVLMAIEMLKKTQDLSDDWIAKGSIRPLKVRIGINTGFCTVGNFGSADRMDYTIIGGQVNIASRLEKLADENSISVSSTTYNFVKDLVDVEPPINKKMKGINHPVDVYKIKGLKNDDKFTDAGYCVETESGFILKPVIFDNNATPISEKAAILSSLETAIKKIRNR